MSDGSLGAEIERSSAEIRSWPNWAQPYDPSQPAGGGASERPTAQREALAGISDTPAPPQTSH
jgi:hypothetical protein